MITVNVKEIYETHIKRLPIGERLQLLAIVAQDLAVQAPPVHSITELHGLGKEIWEEIDAQEYVTQLRQEWDHRP